jgi:thymidine phosphorylase
MRRVVEREGGCVVWGGAVRLSPADDILIRVERALDVDSEGQLVASVISKKVAAGATHLVLDLPVGSTAKVRGQEAAEALSRSLVRTAAAFGVKASVIVSDGSQPVGRGLGPALEAYDVLAVLRDAPDAPSDLKDRAVALAGALLEMTGASQPGGGVARAGTVLADGSAWSKFQKICEAQGGMRVPPIANFRRDIKANTSGRIAAIDNRRIARIAKLSGAPDSKAAGVELHVHLADNVRAGGLLYSIHAESPGELAYALDYAEANPDVIAVAET